MKPLVSVIFTIAFIGIPIKIFTQVIAIGEYCSHSICFDGNVMAWGSNVYGQLGDSSTTYKKLPVYVKNLSNVIAISGKSAHTTHFLKEDGTVWATGRNLYGELGNNTISSQTTTVVPVLGLSGITAIAGGQYHKLFLKNDSTVWACGLNSAGQLGDGTNINRDIPIQIPGLTGVIAISGGWIHSLFLKSDGTVWACGRNYYGQLGDGTTIDRNFPAQILGLTSIKKIEGGMHQSYFLKSDSTVMTCGLNVFGQLGDGTTIDKLTPTQIPNLNQVVEIAGGSHSLFLKDNGTVWACGLNNYGQLADGTTTNKNIPFQIPSLSGIVSVSGWLYHSIFLKNDGTVWASGRNIEGELGDGTIVDKSTPVKTKNLCMVDFTVSSTNDKSLFEMIKFYPNPIQNKLNIETENNILGSSYTLYDLSGRFIFSGKIDAKITSIEISSLSPGFYYICLYKDRVKHTYKLIKD